MKNFYWEWNWKEKLANVAPSVKQFFLFDFVKLSGNEKLFSFCVFEGEIKILRGFISVV